MRVDVRCSEATAGGFSETVRERVARTLGAHAGRIHRVQVELERASEDAQALCHIDVRGDRAWRVIIEEVDADPAAALDRATDRASISVAQTLERLLRTRSSGPWPWPSSRA